LVTPEEIAGARFLDIGCGSGLSMLAATELGAGAVEGFDIDPNSVAATRTLFVRAQRPCAVQVGSVFDPPVKGGYDIVHSWGVLHHTGDMWQAIARAADLTRPGGLFIVALYRRTLACPAWRVEKRLYTRSPRWLQGVISGLYKAAFFTALTLTGRNPRAYIRDYHSRRGMSWRHDVHDWLGGYPYESVSPVELERFMVARGFHVIRRRVSPGGLGLFGSGCDEFVWKRNNG
jgi:SAM-dependent methyltransferase